MDEKFRTFCTNICIQKYMNNIWNKNFENYARLTWNLSKIHIYTFLYTTTFLVTFPYVVFQSEKHLFSRLHYNVKRKSLP